MKAKISFIGLGVMGSPLAGHLANAGYSVTVFNRTTSKALAWLKKYDGSLATSPAETCRDADIIISCVGNDDDLWEITAGPDGILTTAKPNTLFIDHTTTSATMAKQVYALCKKHLIGFVDAPVSGGEQGAINGALTIMCGGDDQHYEQSKSILKHYAKAITSMGSSGNGQLTKMVNQIAICGLLQSLAEAIEFSEKAGLNSLKVFEVISKGAAQSWQMENRHRSMLAGEYRHGFAVDWIRKDLNIVLEEARRNHSILPITALVDQFYAEVQHFGGGRWDTSSLLTRFIAPKHNETSDQN